MKIVIEKAQPHQLKEIIHFIWAQRKFIDEKSLQGDILILLTKLYVPIMTISDDKVKNELLSDLARWIVYVNFFTSETQKIFLEISKHSSDHFNTMQLVEGLNKIVHNSPNEVAEILFTVIDQDEKHPYYKQEVLTNIFDELKKNKLEDWILKICNLFLKKRLYNYKEVLTKYLPQKDK
jgi:Ca2+-binding EF-hand superfamily protein